MSILTGDPGEVITPFNFIRIPIMFVSGMFIPTEQMSATAVYISFLSPLTRTLDLIKLGIGESSYFGWPANISILIIWLLFFLFVGQMFHKIIMKRE